MHGHELSKALRRCVWGRGVSILYKDSKVTPSLTESLTDWIKCSDGLQWARNLKFGTILTTGKMRKLFYPQYTKVPKPGEGCPIRIGDCQINTRFSQRFLNGFHQTMIRLMMRSIIVSYCSIVKIQTINQKKKHK